MAKPNSAAGIAGFLAKPATPPRSPLADDLGGVPEGPESVASVPPQPEPVDGKLVPRGSGVNKFVDAPAALPIARVLSEGGEPTLDDCEQQMVIVTNQWLIATSEALSYIHDGELWRNAKGIVYDSWKGYLRHRWDGMTPQRAHQLMKAKRSARAVAPVAESEIKEAHTRVLDKIFDAVGKNKKLPDEEAAMKACQKVWQAASKQGRPSAAAMERIAAREGYIAAMSEPEPPELPPAPPPAAWQRVEPALAVVQDLDILKDLMKDAPAKGFEVAFHFVRAANEMVNDLGDRGRELLERAVMDGKLPEKLDF